MVGCDNLFVLVSVALFFDNAPFVCFFISVNLPLTNEGALSAKRSDANRSRCFPVVIVVSNFFVALGAACTSVVQDSEIGRAHV